ncbi:MAG: MFS transporter [Terriglobales bacterium]
MHAARSPQETDAVNIGPHTRHQIGLRLLPFLFILYIINYLDRTNVAYAALEMSRELGFSDRVFGLGAGIFFISYVALQIPGALLVEHWSARRGITVIMLAWGALTVLTALVHSAGQLYLARFVLGAAEAGFFPGVVVYMSHWFIREDRAKAGGNFMAAIPLSFIIGSPLAGWILGHDWLGLAGWRWLFFLEGLPALLLGGTAYFYLTDRPAEASWLAPAQREWIVEKLEEEKPAQLENSTIWRTVRNRTVLLLSATAFLQYFVFYTFAFWFPTILKRLYGLSDARLGLLGAVPYVVTLVAMQINGWHSDKQCERRWHAAVPMFLAALALLGLITLRGSIPLTVTLFALVAMGEAFLPVFWAMPAEILRDSAAAAGTGMINAAGSVAGLVGPLAFGYLNSRTGTFSYGLATVMVAALAAGSLVLRAPKPGPAVP